MSQNFRIRLFIFSVSIIIGVGAIYVRSVRNISFRVHQNLEPRASEQVYSASTSKVTALSETPTPSNVSPAIEQSEESAGSRGPVLPPSSASPESYKIIKNLHRFENCFEGLSDCQFSQLTARSYQDEVIASIVRELQALRKLQRTNQDADSVLVLARKYARFPHDDVKEIAFEMLEAAPLSAENFSALIDGLHESVSARLFKGAVPQLEKYRGTSAQASLDQFLINTISRGGHFVAIEAARLSLEFMTPENASHFAAIADGLPLSSKVREYIHLNLREFERLNRGG